jgi:hypothetical protein
MENPAARGVADRIEKLRTPRHVKSYQMWKMSSHRPRNRQSYSPGLVVTVSKSGARQEARASLLRRGLIAALALR